MIPSRFGYDVSKALAHGTSELLQVPEAALRSLAACLYARLMAMKAAVHMALRESGRTKADLARALAVDYREVQRILAPRHRTHIDRLADSVLKSLRSIEECWPR